MKIITKYSDIFDMFSRWFVNTTGFVSRDYEMHDEQIWHGTMSPEVETQIYHFFDWSQPL